MTTTLHFVIVPKLTFDEPFYDTVGLGCASRAKEIGNNVECHYIGYPQANAIEQARVIKELVTDPEKYNLTQVPNGISIAVLDENITGEAIDFVYDAGVPVITFDSDAPQSKRQAFVSTDNYGFGLELGKVLNKLHPNGKKYGMITGSGPNLIGRLNGVRDRLGNDVLTYPTKWKEIDYSPLNCQNNVTLAIEQMYRYAADPDIQAIIPVGGWPMYNPTLWKKFVDSNRHVFTVVADSVDIQLELMGQGYVNGLVGQLPYQMGEFSADELLRINEGNLSANEEVLGTHMLEILRMPLTLPPLRVNENYIGNLAYLGYVLFALVAVASLVVAGWVWLNRSTHVIRASQTVFLLMLCFGTLVLGSSIIPLTFDDEDGNTRDADIACMCVPWLISIGFTTAFAALFSKTWRIYKITQSAQRFERIKVSVKDVLAPYIVLMVMNIVTLLCWTFIAPLKYMRKPHRGTDPWNRVISTYGTCVSVSGAKGGAVPYFVILACVNGFVLIIDNIYAYKSRAIHTEYSESRHIAIIMSSVLQASLIGIPIAVLLYEQPVAYFIVMALLIFVICMAILCFIFIPKAIAVKAWKIEQKDKKEKFYKGTSNGKSEDKKEKFYKNPSNGKSGLKFARVDTGEALARLANQNTAKRADSSTKNKESTTILSDIMKMVQDLSLDERQILHDVLVIIPGLSEIEHQKLMKDLLSEE